MKKLVFILLFVMLNLFQHLSAQNQKKMDSLQTLLNAAKDDTTRLRLYIALGNECNVKDNLKYAEPAIQLADKLLSQNPDSNQRKTILKHKAFAYFLTGYLYNQKGVGNAKALEYYEKALFIYKEINDAEGITNSLTSIAGNYNRQGNSMKELEIYKEGLSLFKKMNDKKKMSRFIVQIANLYADIGDTVHALDYMQKAYVLEQEINDTSRNAQGLLIMGDFYKRMNYIEKALEYYYKAIPRYAKKDKKKLGGIYFRIGDAYEKKNDLVHSLEYFKKCLSMCEEMKLGWLSNEILLRLGGVYRDQGDITKALDYHYKSLKISEQNDSGFIVFSCAELARDYVYQKNYKKAKEFSDRYVTSMQENNIRGVLDAEQLAAKVDSAVGDYKEAYGHFQQYIILRDKLKNDEVSKIATREKFQEEADKQKAEQEKKDAITVAENRKQKVITGSVIAGLLLVLVFAVFVLRSLNVTRKQKQIIEIKSKEVEEHQKEIIDSITYAKRLQQAILPSLNAVKELLPNSFVYYQPKDIVAGDFYWMHTTKELTFIAAADCTGHGVPGAMVSVVCSNALNRAVNEFNLTDTALILDKTRELVIETFKKSDAEVKDGMDISLLRIENLKDGKKEVQWSGANNSLWYVLNNELIEVKADKQPIGKYSEAKPFTTNNFTFNASVTFYLFSDGYADQFSPDDKKLMKKKFKDIVLSIQNLSMAEQKNYLDKFHTDWKANMEQTDDVLVIGVKV